MATVYKAPGVTSREIEIAGLPTIPGGVQRPGIIGSGTDWILQRNVPQTKSVTQAAGGADTLKKLDGSYTISGEVQEVLNVSLLAGGSLYILGTDYTVSDNTIVWVAGKGPEINVTYYVNMKINKPASYYDPLTFYDIDDVRNAYGYELEDGEIRPITLAAKMLFDNGASLVICVQQASTGYSDFTAAVDKLKKEEVDFIISPNVADNDNNLTYLVQHVQDMSSILEAKERMTIVGASLSNTSVSTMKTKAESIADEKVVYMAPPQVQVLLHDYSTREDETKWVSVYYAGAALVGKACNPNYDVAEPFLRKSLTSITAITNYLRSEANDLATSGVCVLEQDGSFVKIRHDLTTYVGDARKEQFSIPRIKFYTIKRWRTLLDNKYIGQKLLAGTLENIKIDSTGYLMQLISDKILSAYRNLKVEQDASEPRKVNVYCEIQPIFPLVWIEIIFGIYAIS